MAEKGASGIVQIAIALIGVIGSLGVAYITTGAKFKSEVDEASLRIASLSKEVKESKDLAQEVQTKLSTQQGDVEKRIAALQQELSSAASQNTKFQEDLNALRDDINSSKQKVNEVHQTADKAIASINAARTRAITERPAPTP